MCFFDASVQGTDADATSYKGFYHRFFSMRSEMRVWSCELSTVDTAFLLAAMLTTAAFVLGVTDNEREIRELGGQPYWRADWKRAQNGGTTVCQGWQGYDEAMFLYPLDLGSPTNPLPANRYAEWTSSYQWRRIYGHELLYSGPLFTHQISNL